LKVTRAGSRKWLSWVESSTAHNNWPAIERLPAFIYCEDSGVKV